MQSIQIKYLALVFLFVVAGFGAVIYRTAYLKTAEKDLLVHIGDSLHNKTREEKPRRGNIYSDEGKLLAASAPQYLLYMDFSVPLLQNNDTIFRKNVDSLALCLSKKFKDKTKNEYKQLLVKAHRKKSGFVKLTDKTLSTDDFCEIKTFPLLCFGSKGGLILDDNTISYTRSFPYGNLGEATIGRLPDRKGSKLRGLEAACDSFLNGKSGTANRERRAGADIWVAKQKSENGADVISTLNVEIQDIADKALRRKLTELDADSGCVVIMDVKTGQIKACVNLRKSGAGKYREQDNIALVAKLEPGSTFKVPAMIAMLEDGKITAASEVDCGEGIWIHNNDTIEDHNRRRGGNGVITAEQAIVRSSNIGMAKFAYNAYKDNPQAYVDALRRVGVGKPFDVGFGSLVAKPVINNLRKTNIAELKSMSYGYALEMPLLYTLTYYNAIANNGTMVAPYLIKAIVQEKDTVKQFAPVVLQEKICSQRTLEAIKKMMLLVLEDSLHATGKPVKSSYLHIAGKTGTARYDYKQKRNTKHRVSFCGFFPYENPQYTCIVFIQNPKKGEPSGGGMAGVVFKDIAERTMAMKKRLTIDEFCKLRYPAGVSSYTPPELTASAKSFQTMLDNLLAKKDNTVPDVRGMGLKDAVYMLEKAGLKVLFEGYGKVGKQSLTAGKSYKKGETITLFLH